MSLDFYLEGKPETRKCICSNCENEHEYQHSKQLFWKNITHNLTNMAHEAGLYKCLWHPNENGFTEANQIIPLLEAGLEKLKANPEYFERFNSPNGWGSYKYFVPFVEECLNACKEYPDANVRTST